MYLLVSWKVLRLSLLAFTGAFVLAAPAILAQTNSAPAGFVQVLPGTGNLPLGAYRIVRKGAEIPADSALMPCDSILFVPQQQIAATVWVTTVKGGKNLRLNQEHPALTLSCDAVTVSTGFVRMLAMVTGGSRAQQQAPALTEKGVAAATRGAPGRPEELTVPSLPGKTSQFIAGKRALYVAWQGGAPPYQVELIAKDTGKRIAYAKSMQASWVRLPAVALPVGAYRLSILDASNDRPLVEDQLFAVEATALPPQPPSVSASGLAAPEQRLLYAYFLEGVGDGIWTFEAMQMLANATPRKVRPMATRQWLAAMGLTLR